MKIIKKFIALVLVFAFVFLLVACKNKEAEISIKENTASFDPVSFETDKGIITVLGSEKTKDSKGNAVIRVYYDFENKYELPSSVYDVFTITAKQDNEIKEKTLVAAENNVKESLNYSLRVYTGAKVRCADAYPLKTDGGKFMLVISDKDDETVQKQIEFDPKTFSGKPKENLKNNFVFDKVYFDNLSLSGTVADNYVVKVLDSEKIKADNGQDALRVYFEFTNNSDTDASFWRVVDGYIIVSQNGVELSGAYISDKITEDENYNKDIKKGETVIVSKSYFLSSDSPVAVEITGFYNEDIGKMFS